MPIRIPALTGFPLNDQQLSLLGEVAALGALIESVADGILCRLITEDREAIAPVVAGQQVSWVMEKIKEIANRASDDATAIREWVAASRVPLEHRNLLVHSTWLMPTPDRPGSTVGYRRRRGGGPEFHFKTSAEMAVIRDELVATYQTGLAIAQRLHAIDPEEGGWTTSE